ncbi:MAG: hypothetical protein ACREIC_06450 [Limisphaerales bacterium]
MSEPKPNESETRGGSCAPARGSANHGDWELLNRLRLLYAELKQEEKLFHSQENDEAECVLYAAAERLREVTQGYLAGEVYSPNRYSTAACGIVKQA